MSVRILSLVWQTDLPATEKMVMLALADAANDDGNCWPPISGERGLCKKTSLSERAVQKAIKSLCAGGQLDRLETPGKGVFYTLTPAPRAPPQEVRPAPRALTPAPRAPKPSITVIEASEAKASSATRAEVFPRPEWADKQVWADFLTNRKKKRLSNTATAHKGFLAAVLRLADDEWPPGRLLEYAVGKGWGGIYPPDEGARNGQGTDSLTAIALQKLAASGIG